MGLWIVFEGPDGAGKSTVMVAVANKLKQQLTNTEIIQTIHPGSTPIGAYLRSIVKDPVKYGFDLDSLTSQMLMAVDHISFKTSILLPALDRNAIVLADRCDMTSSLIYGLATGVKLTHLNSLIQIMRNPRIDKLFILQCDDNIRQSRLHGRHIKADRFEATNIQSKVTNFYNNLLSLPDLNNTILLNEVVALDDIEYVDSSIDINELSDKLAKNIAEKYNDGDH